MNMKTLTISIAAYNMEKYIEDALNSLIDERVIDDLEIFVVDDGGTDRTLEIAQAYANKYPGSIFPIHKENGGYGSTVNYSIQHATGKYFKLLDGDDWFNTEGLYQLIMLLKATDADVITTERQKTCDVIDHRYKPTKENELYQVKKICDVLSLRMLSTPELTYKTEVLKRSDVKLPERILYTDGIYMVIPFCTAETILMTDILVYFYRVGRDGQSISKESMIKHKNEQVEVLRQLMLFCAAIKEKNHPNYLYIKKAVSTIYIITIKFLLIQPVSKSVQREIKDFETEMKAISEDIFNEAEKTPGKVGFLLNWLRKTNYHIYWLLKFIPEDVKK